MIKVLHILAGADIGGISQVVVNYCRYINSKDISIDVAFTTDCEGQNANHLREMGVNIYQLPIKSHDIKKYQRKLIELLEKTKYDCIHVHENSTSYVALRIAKKKGIKIRVAHAHSCVVGESMIAKIKRLSGCIFNYVYATNLISCGEKAGDIVYGKIAMLSKKSVILKNAIETQKFVYSEELRKEIRKDLEMENKYIIGMVGRLSKEKNIYFILKLMEELRISIPNIHLLLIGDGEERNGLEKYILDNGIQDIVTLYGKTNFVEKYYNALDLLVLPSFYEGFPLVVVEAVASGLPVITSTNVSDEISIFEDVSRIDLEDIDEWKMKIRINGVNNKNRKLKSNKFYKYGFDIKNNVEILEKIYMSK